MLILSGKRKQKTASIFAVLFNLFSCAAAKQLNKQKGTEGPSGLDADRLAKNTYIQQLWHPKDRTSLDSSWNGAYSLHEYSR